MKALLGKAAIVVVAAGLLVVALAQLSTALENRTMIKPPGEVIQTVISPGGNILVTLHDTGRALIVERLSEKNNGKIQKKIGEIRGHSAPIKHIQFSPDGKYITSVDASGRGLRTVLSGIKTRDTLHGAYLVSAAERHIWQDGLGIIGDEARQAIMFDMPMAPGRQILKSDVKAPVLPAGFAPPAPGRMFRDCDTCPEMVVVPAGTFVMGSPESEEGRSHVEGPQHTITISQNIAVGRFEITLAQYRRFIAETGLSETGNCISDLDGDEEAEPSAKPDWRDPGFEQASDYSVACISWEDAKKYTDWLSDKTGEEYRLLSEAEWEYAARGVMTTNEPSTKYGWGDEAPVCEQGQANGAVFSRCSDIGTKPVGFSEVNAFGLYDMHGNVWEWVEDCWNSSYAGASSNGSARLSGECNGRVLRGGSWNYYPQDLRSANRGRLSTTVRVNDVGFRIARTLED